MRKTWLAFVLAVAAGCPSIDTDPGEGQDELPPLDGPTVEFDPANKIIPFPNNLVRDPMTGRINLPQQCNESPATKATREGVLNKLDGFGTYEVGLQATFSEAVDPATLDGNIVLYPLTMTGLGTPVMTTTRAGMTVRFSADCSTPSMINSVSIIPLAPLQQKTTYVAAVLQGVKTATGADYLPSFTWALVRQKTAPVTTDASGNVLSESTPLDPAGDANHDDVPDIEQLKGIDLLWKAHAQALTALDADAKVAGDRSKVLLAWTFTTQTVTDPLDPMVTDSPANKLASVTPLLMASITCDFDATTCPRGYVRTAFPFSQCPGGDTNTQCFLKIALGGGNYAVGNATCAQVGCAAIGDILAGGIGYTNYQVPGPNPLAGGAMIPGAWDDPVNPTQQGGGILETLFFIPATPGPYPTVVFGHGLGSSKTALFAFAPQLAANGFASVSIDFVAHGSRAIRTSKEPTIGCIGHCSVTTATACDLTSECPGGEQCVGAPAPTTAPQCYAPVFSTNLGTTRDNVRQTVLDLQRTIKSVKACGTTGCASGNSAAVLSVSSVLYAGQSLGGILGSIVTATSPDVKAALLNVPGVGWGDILENTQTLDIRCLLVDSLIDAGILMGEKYNRMAGTGLCTTQAWQDQPGYAQFRAILRWVMDPADPANFNTKLAMKRFFIQEVVGDKVVPNIATDREGALVGLMPQNADVNNGLQQTPPPSAALTSMPMMSKWLRYMDVPAANPFPGNTFEHPSLLRPSAGNAGLLGTQRMQTDAIYWLFQNK